MLKERLFTMVAAGAIVGAALTTNLLPQAGQAQQREIIVTQPGLLAQQTQPQQQQLRTEEPGAAEEGTGEAKQTDRLADPTLFVREQEAAETIASALIGQPLYNQQADRLGDISDLVFSEDGALKAVIVGVGGFLGIGEKKVAIRYDGITTTRQPESDEMLLVINATSDDLQAAPEFETVAMKVAREQAEKAAAEQQSAAPQPLEQPAPSD